MTDGRSDRSRLLGGARPAGAYDGRAMLAFDHAVIAVADLDEAAERIRRSHGLGSLPGGRHPGHGTGNRIIPLGPDYLELMAVLDPTEAATSPMGRWVADVTRGGDRLGALCLRTSDIEDLATRLGLAPFPMSRRTPNGETLSWRLVGLEAALRDGLPFFIQWDTDSLPGEARCSHAVEPSGIRWVEFGGDQTRFEEWVGPHDLDIRLLPGRPGPMRVAVNTDRGEIVLSG